MSKGFFRGALTAALLVFCPMALAQESGSSTPPDAGAGEADAGASGAEAPGSRGEQPAAAASEDARDAEPSVRLHGSVEAYYSYNLNEPSNGINANRFYDTRHNLLGLQNAYLSTEWEAGPVEGHVQLQLGAFHELFWPGERSVEEDLLWRLMQEVTAEWHTPWRPLSIEGGVFNVPFGPEYNVAYLNWNWGTSNLFAIMPYQIAGFRANLDLGKGWIARLGVYNGWDRVVTDNNSGKSVMGAIEYTNPDDDETYFVAEYMAGNERDREDPRGPYLRHTLDVYGQWHLASPFTVRGHLFTGVEPGRDGRDGWLGGALSARYAIVSWLSVAVRGDVLHVSAGGGQNMFFSDNLDDANTDTTLQSTTLTLDLHPTRNVSIRLEGRHDRTDFPLFYRGLVRTVPMGGPRDFVGNDSNQTTVTAGMTTWF